MKQFGTPPPPLSKSTPLLINLPISEQFFHDPPLCPNFKNKISSPILGGNYAFDIASIIQQYPDSFKGLRKMKNYQVKLYSDENVKHVAFPPRTIHYHLWARVADSIDNMIKDGVNEEHPNNEPAPWVSCAVVVPKGVGSCFITLDACNVNKAIISSNHPIPKQDVIKAQLSGSKIFSKLDF